MGSGLFPIHHRFHPRQVDKLLLAAKLIGEVLEWVDEDPFEDICNGQWDNARSDGGALARLELARELLLGEVVPPEPPEEGEDRGGEAPSDG